MHQASDDTMGRYRRRMSSSPGRQRQRQPSDDNMLGLTGIHRQYQTEASTSSNTLPTAPAASMPNLAIDTPSPLYTRRPSTEAFRNQPSTSTFRVPQPTYGTERVSGYSTDLEIPLISSPPYNHSPLPDERILAPMRPGGGRLTPPPPLIPPPPQSPRRHSRNVSRDASPGGTDPRMLFSGAVRAAGYMRSPSQTRA